MWRDLVFFLVNAEKFLQLFVNIYCHELGCSFIIVFNSVQADIEEGLACTSKCMVFFAVQKNQHLQHTVEGGAIPVFEWRAEIIDNANMVKVKK